MSAVHLYNVGCRAVHDVSWHRKYHLTYGVCQATIQRLLVNGDEQMAIDYERISRRIQELRKLKHLTQADLAMATGLSVPYISHIETGEKKPSLQSVALIADALDIRMDQLIYGKRIRSDQDLEDEITELLADCSIGERQLMLDLFAALKDGLRSNRWFSDHYLKGGR